MADEGEFPKIDGDILYASEANRFQTKLVDFIDKPGVLGSEADYGIIGSIMYSGTYPHIMSQYMTISAQVQTGNASATQEMRFRISGTEFDFACGSVVAVVDTETAGTRPLLSSQYAFTSGNFVTQGGTDFTNPLIIFLEGKPENSDGGTMIGKNFMVTCV